MTEYHVVLEGSNGFQKEEQRAFPHDYPPPSLHLREYAALSFVPLTRLANEPNAYETLNVKERCFRQRCRLYALGKHIVYYTEERN